MNLNRPESNGFLPSFFVVGPPRTGTTWIYEALRKHANLPAPTKETRFFDLHFHRGLAWYRAHFPSTNSGRLIGEVAPTYFASREACARIARHVPYARVVCIFRDPVERVLSLYRVKRAYGMIPWNFEEALFRDPELLNTGKYASTLLRWRNAFGSDRVLATFYDDLCADPQRYVNTLAEFVGIPPFHLSPSERESVHASDRMTHPRSYLRTREATRIADWCKARRLDKLVAAIRNSPLRRLFLGGGTPFTQVAQDLAAQVYELFRPEIDHLEQLVGRDLSSWKGIASVAQIEAA